MPDGRFLTTRWSVVRNAGRASASSSAALSELCEAYWYPLYAFVRRSGHGADEARDLTQGFFARLLEKREFEGADPERGRFRTFLLNGMKFHLANEREKARALKRGGGRAPLSIDHGQADSRYGLEATDELTPERLFERAWALALVDRVLDALGEEYAARGKGALFDALRSTLTGGAGESRAELAERLDTTENALKVAIHRLRARFGERLRGEIADTVADEADIEDELRHLFDVLGS